jgi:uncharacterized BrkB/YihY/UPF0761 family membrane protein
MTVIPYLRAANVILLLVGTVATGWFEEIAMRADYSLSLDAFSVWVASPYFLLLIPSVLVQTKKGQVAILAFVVFMVVGGLFAYYDTMFLSRGSTGGLVFLFLPLWQLLIAIGITVGVIVTRVRRSAANRSHDTAAQQEQPRAG